MNIVLIHLFHLAEFPCVQTINYTTLFKPPSIFECFSRSSVKQMFMNINISLMEILLSGILMTGNYNHGQNIWKKVHILCKTLQEKFYILLPLSKNEGLRNIGDTIKMVLDIAKYKYGSYWLLRFHNSLIIILYCKMR